VTNAGDTAVGGWVVSLTVPGAEDIAVTSGDVAVSQAGSSVGFRPAGAGVPASGSVSFTFTLDPVPADPPAGCTLDGEPCA
jgi:hypothetical protein